jgi:hypothetical protein
VIGHIKFSHLDELGIGKVRYCMASARASDPRFHSLLRRLNFPEWALRVDLPAGGMGEV